MTYFNYQIQRAYKDLEVKRIAHLAEIDLSKTVIKIGSEFCPGGTLFFGRSANGEVDQSPEALFSAEEPLWDVEYSFREIIPAGRYNHSRSAYWRYIRSLMMSLGFTSENWYKKVAVDNLCHLVPTEEGNPSDVIFYETFNENLSILKTELHILQPNHVVFLTGKDWANPFLEALGLDVNQPKAKFYWDNNNSVLQFEYQLDNVTCHIHVADHPQGKSSSMFDRIIMSVKSI